MFGMTRERVRQHFVVHNLNRREESGALYRVWSDEEDRFVTTSVKNLNSRLIKERRNKKEERREEIRQLHVKTLQRLEKERGKTPTISALGEALGYKRVSATAASIVHYWGYSDQEGGCSPQEAMDNLYNAAGIEGRLKRGFVTRENDTLGGRLSQKRRERGLTLKEVGNFLKLDGSSISHHEKNGDFPSSSSLEKYSSFYGVSEKWILTGED